MGSSPLRQFAVTVVAAVVVGVPLAALLTPPDPYTQVLALGLLLAVTLPVAYALSYGGGYEALRARDQ
jgi:Sec-independent protein secretion pathway component TatC